MTDRVSSYDPNYGWGEHRYRITIMQDDYVGHIFGRVGGNAKGASILQHALACLYDSDLLESDCHFERREAYGETYFMYKLKNPAGRTLTADSETLEEIENMVVAVEIVGYEKEIDHCKGDGCERWKPKEGSE